jgi:hypothetical protein
MFASIGMGIGSGSPNSGGNRSCTAVRERHGEAGGDADGHVASHARIAPATRDEARPADETIGRKPPHVWLESEIGEPHDSRVEQSIPDAAEEAL